MSGPGAQPGLTFDPGPHVYRWRGDVVPSVTQVQGAAGLAPDYSMVPADLLARKALMGTLVHEQLDAVVSGEEGPDHRARVEASDVVEQGDVDEVLARIRGYVRAGDRFLTEMDVRVVASERRLYSELYGYAGTLDVCGFLGMRRACFDWKTTSEIHPVAVGTQTMGYRTAWNEVHPDRRVERRYAVQLMDDGTYRLHPMDDPADERRWLAAVQPDGKDPVLERARSVAVRRALEFL